MTVFGKSNLNKLINYLEEIPGVGIEITRFWVLPVYKVQVKYYSGNTYNPANDFCI